MDTPDSPKDMQDSTPEKNESSFVPPPFPPLVEKVSKVFYDKISENEREGVSKPVTMSAEEIFKNMVAKEDIKPGSKGYNNLCEGLIRDLNRDLHKINWLHKLPISLSTADEIYELVPNLFQEHLKTLAIKEKQKIEEDKKLQIENFLYRVKVMDQVQTLPIKGQEIYIIEDDLQSFEVASSAIKSSVVFVDKSKQVPMADYGYITGLMGDVGFKENEPADLFKKAEKYLWELPFISRKGFHFYMVNPNVVKEEK